ENTLNEEVCPNLWPLLSKGGSNQSVPDPERFSSPTLRIVISVVYSVVCAVGLVGNAMVFFLMKVRRGRKRSTINFYILNLAVTDFQFVLTLPFWAAENALDFSWPFGNAMCKIILSVTVMNVYASVFFLTAMSVARYWSVASALKDRSRVRACSVRWVCALLWASATAASVPTAVFATETRVFNDKLCLLKFPDQYLLALYHLHRILIAFVLPMCVVSVCYVMLLRLIRLRSMNNNHPKRRSRVTRSVAIVVLSFFICWLPNHAITFWSVLVKFNLAQWDEAYYAAHTYMFPVSACLAHTNSCLNPLLYCLMRSEIRKTIKSLCWRMSSPAGAPGGCQVLCNVFYVISTPFYCEETQGFGSSLR
uniref:G-protein coupled receptors family 1 profile domain-containing protein n=1 Tax=Denticeps clupeoides TaxID=299321 RepID=A0AAY4EEQ6_9TELE